MLPDGPLLVLRVALVTARSSGRASDDADRPHGRDRLYAMHTGVRVARVPASGPDVGTCDGGGVDTATAAGRASALTAQSLGRLFVDPDRDHAHPVECNQRVSGADRQRRTQCPYRRP